MLWFRFLVYKTGKEKTNDHFWIKGQIMPHVLESLLLSGLAVIGGLCVLYLFVTWSWKCWCLFRTYVLSEIWHVNLRTYGQWAVVTGATSGIGKAYAHELSKRGLDIVLISRSKDKLNLVAKEIESLYGRQTITIQTDFTEGFAIYPAIDQQLQGLNIGILVNNVGMNYTGHFARFLEVPDCEQRITQVVNCNIVSVSQMTKMVLPRMVERGRGLIINLSSEAGARPQPLLALYSSTKTFVTYFSRCLNAEYQSRGVTVQCVAPLMVSTNMTHNIPTNFLVKTASDFAREALNTVGFSSFTSGCLSHALQNIALSVLLPDWLRLSSYCVSQLEKIPDPTLTNEKTARKMD